MTRVRRLLGPIAAAWLSCQLAGVVTTPIVVWMTTRADHVECTCGHGDHAICPMHHRPASGTRCALRSTHNTNAAVLSSLFSSVGVLTATTTTMVATTIVVAPSFERVASSRGPVGPDPPPPRA